MLQKCDNFFPAEKKLGNFKIIIKMKLDINVASIKKFRKKIEMMSQVKSMEKIERKKNELI